ncbi:LysR family transcriptional regulator [Brooklawnia cerclae]|uniref:DNA-binding transcriptional LysR family regulator n=1 Tax=Brooklawnia cerclae TaxID=349934 RepID=A0ABX0SGP4_9ACTN|nr:LysR family transcriptional regulator [Brooklawnia cerclae]NIH57160.1 DNA-binding transcriptional LysR family regulator [Brooklawnia cerclae]
MELRHLELMRDLEHYGSLTAVARATFRTPSAVSQQLRTAQRDLRVPLVEPDGRGVRLTEAGRILAEGCTDVAAALERVQARWDAFRDDLSGTVSIASLPSAATFLMARVFRALDDTGIEIVIHDHDVAEAQFASLAAEVDIVIGHSLTGRRPAGTDGLTVVALAREPLDVAMAAGHRLAGQARIRPDDLLDCEWIGVPVGYPFDTVRLAIESATGASLRIQQRLRDNRLIESLVASSECVAILPRFTTPNGGGLVLRELEGVPATRYVSAILRPDKAERRAVRRVLDELRRAGAAGPLDYASVRSVAESTDRVEPGS